jgi:ATP-dependent DNA ligase
MVSNTSNADGHGDRIFEAVCKLGLEGIVSKRLTSVYRSGPSMAENQKSEGVSRDARG